MSMKKCWLPGFLTPLPTEKNKNVVLWQSADQIYPPFSLYAGHFFFFLPAWYFKRIITYCLLHPYLSSLMSLFSPTFPSHFLFLYPSHTETDTPPSPSSYSRGMSKCACPTQRGVRRVTDKTCSALLWHLSEPHLSSVCRDGNEQEWHNMPEVTVTAYLFPSASKSVA